MFHKTYTNYPSLENNMINFRKFQNLHKDQLQLLHNYDEFYKNLELQIDVCYNKMAAILDVYQKKIQPERKIEEIKQIVLDFQEKINIIALTNPIFYDYYNIEEIKIKQKKAMQMKDQQFHNIIRKYTRGKHDR